MIVFENKQELIDAYQEIGSPLDDNHLNDLEFFDSELRNLGLSLQWVVITSKCRICNHKETGLVPQIADLDNLECANCGNMALQETDELEWWE